MVNGASIHKKFIMSNFNFAFGQHSGVIDLNKDKFELPRFPINEKYGDLEIGLNFYKFLPLQYKKVFLKKNDKLIIIHLYES